MTADLQRTWDTALIQSWRQSGNLLDAIQQWENHTGASFQECFTDLKRTPPPGYFWKAGARSFVAAMLPLISDRLWKQPPERDAALIDKLQTSGYTIHKKPQTDADRDRQRLKRSTAKNQQKITLSITKYADRNSATDGRTVSGSARRTRR